MFSILEDVYYNLIILSILF